MIYERDDGSLPYLTFRKSLDLTSAIVLDASIEEILAKQGNNVCKSSWGKALGKGLYEFRIRKPINAIYNHAQITPPISPSSNDPVLLRVFFSVEGQRIVLLIGGYDKGSDPTAKRQSGEIKQARKLLVEHKSRSRQKRTKRSLDQ